MNMKVMNAFKLITLSTIILINLNHSITAKMCLNFGRPYINDLSDALEQLRDSKLVAEGAVVNLHLGCGESHLNEYINIDFPPSEHTVQIKSGADVFADITKIRFNPNSIHEIRSHHVFEHFDRPTALALLCAWATWLTDKGVLFIETPDFLTSIQMLSSDQYTYTQKQIILRHIFGSHEAPWAIHCDGWYKEKFEHILKKFGFGDILFEFSSYLLTRNIKVVAKKMIIHDKETLTRMAYEIMRESLVDPGEEKMADVWCNKFDTIFDQLLIKN